MVVLGFIAIIFLAVVITAFFSDCGVVDNYRGNKFFVDDYKEITRNINTSSKDEDYHFEETESFIDSAGNEHIVNEDFYCEDCDDFHDDY